MFGDHLVVRRLFHQHHGIDTGAGVIHYAKTGVLKAEVMETSHEEFARGGAIEVRDHENAVSPVETVARARSRIGEKKYRLFGNNCEHLAEEAKARVGVSHQIQFAVGLAAICLVVLALRE